MYNAQETATRIKKLLIDKGITGRKLCTDCNIGINTLSNLKRGHIKNIEIFYVISDYLDVSIDYLVGRTDNLKNK